MPMLSVHKCADNFNFAFLLFWYKKKSNNTAKQLFTTFNNPLRDSKAAVLNLIKFSENRLKPWKLLQKTAFDL